MSSVKNLKLEKWLNYLLGLADSALFAIAPGIKAPRSDRKMRREASVM
jgi:hypothetical protein